MNTRLLLSLLMLAIPHAGSAAAGDVASLAGGAPGGLYRLDRTHASLIFRVSHMGFSHYTARFTDLDAELAFDPRDPAASRLTATIEARSIETDFPFPEQIDFDETLRGESWLDTAAHPRITFQSRQVVMTGPNTARIDGDLTLLGVTRPVALEATFNGGYPGMALDPNARIGVSARGALRRSEFGMSLGLPEPGSNMGVSDAVEVIIETEFSGPAWQGAADEDDVD